MQATNISRKILWLFLFSLAMGYMESAVVVYLRDIYYPDGFCFPLVPIDPSLALTEFLREAATIMMLAGVGILSGGTSSQKFAGFIFCFAVWDLAYYLFLKILIGWPESLLTWDILFLIPVPWVGPVLAPVIVSLTMMLMAMLVFYFESKRVRTGFLRMETYLLISGCIVIIVSFTTDYFAQLINAGTIDTIWTPGTGKALFAEIVEYIPTHYNWWIFFSGESLLLAGIFLYRRRLLATLNSAE